MKASTPYFLVSMMAAMAISNASASSNLQPGGSAPAEGVQIASVSPVSSVSSVGSVGSAVTFSTVAAAVESDRSVVRTGLDDAQLSLCAGTLLSIAGGTEEDLAMACRALSRAVGFWSERMPEEVMEASGNAIVHIEFRDTVPANALAVYHVASKTIIARQDMLAAMQGKRIFGLPMSRELAQSVLVHEISHALTEHFYADLAGVGVEDEYTAFVAQIETLEGPDRERVWAQVMRFVPEIPSESSFDSLSYELHRQAFGLMAHRHFCAGDGGNAFFRRIFSRRFVAPVALGG